MTLFFSWRYGQSNSGVILKCELTRCGSVSCELKNFWIVSCKPSKLRAAVRLACELRGQTYQSASCKIMFIFRELCHRVSSPDLHTEYLDIFHAVHGYTSLTYLISVWFLPSSNYSMAVLLNYIVWKVAVFKVDIKLISSFRNTNLVKFSLNALI